MWLMHSTNQQTYSKQSEFWASYWTIFFPPNTKKKKKNRKELQDKTCKTFILHELLGSYKTGISDEAQERFQLKVS